MYELKFERDFNKLSFKQDGKFKTRVYNKIEKLKTNSYREGKKLKGSDFRSAEIGSYRLLYSVNDKEKVVEIYRLKHRKNAYGNI